MTKQDPSKHSFISLFNNNCTYLNDILTVNNPKKHIYPQELTLNKANITSDSSQIFLFRHIPFKFFMVNLTHKFTAKETIFLSLSSIPFFLMVTFLWNLHGAYISQ
jgi:hypothetical protein